MATAEELAADALAIANEFLAGQQRRFMERAGGDLNVLVEAARIVQKEAAHGSPLEHSGEHLAFSLLTVAFEAGRKSH